VNPVRLTNGCKSRGDEFEMGGLGQSGCDCETGILHPLKLAARLALHCSKASPHVTRTVLHASAGLLARGYRPSFRGVELTGFIIRETVPSRPNQHLYSGQNGLPALAWIPRPEQGFHRSGSPKPLPIFSTHILFGEQHHWVSCGLVQDAAYLSRPKQANAPDPDEHPG
jgi:hypothetical protein